MARLNQVLSQTPAASSPRSDEPSSAPSSDKENQSASAARDKTNARMPQATRPSKRPRLQAQSSIVAADDEEYDELRYYNPAQDQHERQEVKKRSRALERELYDNKDIYVNSDNNGINNFIDRANHTFGGIKQTSDATVDSRLMVSVSEIAVKKSSLLVIGDNSTGVDVDEFVSKCIRFMRDDHGQQSTQHRRQRQSRREQDDDDDDEQEESNDVLDWARLGSHACFPFNVRPPAPSFLLGPLSVQKKIRAQTQRRARQQKDSAVKEVRPEALTERDLQSNESNALTTLCQGIKKQLEAHCATASAAIEALGDLEDDQVLAEMRRNRISPTGGPSLFDFAINPRSFGQTVENLFYISFLIKEGNVGLEMDDDGLPTLLPATPQTVSEQRERGSKRHQAVFSIDYVTWQCLIQAFKIREPLISNRETASGGGAIGARGWYNG